ncbi:AlpA family phage regulatory protein [Vibrio alginolyticus]|nr:AlpA family phage regulatory protein [Vibrio alginolyticus]ELI1596680.1 AlpA family phage regulatory protein [Vibrio alginolyticus]
MYRQHMQKPTDIAYLTNRHVSTIYRWINEGLLPRPLYAGNRILGWRHETIEAWLSSLEETNK